MFADRDPAQNEAPHWVTGRPIRTSAESAEQIHCWSTDPGSAGGSAEASFTDYHRFKTNSTPEMTARSHCFANGCATQDSRRASSFVSFVVKSERAEAKHSRARSAFSGFRSGFHGNRFDPYSQTAFIIRERMCHYRYCHFANISSIALLR
jgi:hypothetical protein